MSYLRTVATLGFVVIDGVKLEPTSTNYDLTVYAAYTEADSRYVGVINKRGRFYEAVPKGRGGKRHEMTTSMAEAVAYLQSAGVAV